MAEDPTAPPRGPELADAVAAVVNAWADDASVRRWVVDGAPSFGRRLTALARAAGREVPQ